VTRPSVCARKRSSQERRALSPVLQRQPGRGELLSWNPVCSASDPLRKRCKEPHHAARIVQTISTQRALGHCEQELRGTDGSSVPVIQDAVGTFDESGEIISGYFIDETAWPSPTKDLSARALEFLQKPYRLRDFSRTIREILDTDHTTSAYSGNRLALVEATGERLEPVQKRRS
jgi:hypothetical protein